MSVVHRAMEDCWRQLAQDLGVEVKRCVSYSQIKRIIRSIDTKSFNSINESYFGSIVVCQGQVWRSADGKELRGSIDGAAGQTRGQNVVSLTSHRGGQSAVVGYYDGSKESEKPVVTAHFELAGPLKDGYSRIGGPIRRVAHFPAQFGADRPAGGHLPGAGKGKPGRTAGGLRVDPPAPSSSLL